MRKTFSMLIHSWKFSELLWHFASNKRFCFCLQRDNFIVSLLCDITNWIMTNLRSIRRTFSSSQKHFMWDEFASCLFHCDEVTAWCGVIFRNSSVIYHEIFKAFSGCELHGKSQSSWECEHVQIFYDIHLPSALCYEITQISGLHLTKLERNFMLAESSSRWFYFYVSSWANLNERISDAFAVHSTWSVSFHFESMIDSRRK